MHRTSDQLIYLIVNMYKPGTFYVNKILFLLKMKKCNENFFLFTDLFIFDTTYVKHWSVYVWHNLRCSNEKLQIMHWYIRNRNSIFIFVFPDHESIFVHVWILYHCITFKHCVYVCVCMCLSWYVCTDKNRFFNTKKLGNGLYSVI